MIQKRPEKVAKYEISDPKMDHLDKICLKPTALSLIKQYLFSLFVKCSNQFWFEVNHKMFFLKISVVDFLELAALSDKTVYFS